MNPFVLGSLSFLAGGVLLAMVARYWFQRGREQKLQTLAARCGWEFAAKDPQLDGLGFTGLSFFAHLRNRSYSNVMRLPGERNQTLVFDFRCRVGNLITAVTCSSILTDIFWAARRNQAPSFRSITMVAFRSDSEWVAPFRVRNSRAIGGNVPPEALQILQGARGHVHAEGAGDWLLVFRLNGSVNVKYLEEFVRQAQLFAEHSFTHGRVIQHQKAEPLEQKVVA